MEERPEFTAERIGAILHLTIQRPHAANSVNAAVASGLVSGLAQALEDDAIRAVVLTGAGERVFCAGRDLKKPDHLDAEGLDRQRRQELRSYTEALLAFDKPLVVALNGTAVGAGFMLALHADQVVAADHATVSLPEVDIGIPTFPGHALVAGLAGNALANDLVLTGRRVTATEALHHGLVHAVVPAARLAQEASERAAALAAKPSATFRTMKGWILAQRRAAVLRALDAHDALEQQKPRS